MTQTSASHVRNAEVCQKLPLESPRRLFCECMTDIRQMLVRCWLSIEDEHCANFGLMSAEMFSFTLYSASYP